MLVLIVVVSLALTDSLGGEPVQVLLTGHIQAASYQLQVFFRNEPLIDYVGVPSRDDGLVGEGTERMRKFIRQYFPRTYEEMKTFDYILFNSPEYYLFTTEQDKWMHDAIEEGAGGFNDASVFSIWSDIHFAWANSLTQMAFPNDAHAVIARGAGGESPASVFTVIVNRDFPDPVLTPYIPYGIEQVACSCSRYVIPRETAKILACQFGNFPMLGKVPYLVVWDYGEGRTMTVGDCMGYDRAFFRIPSSSTDNPYAADILMNLIFYSTGRELIRDVDLFHRIKANFANFKGRLEVLISLMDFIDGFGANTQPIQDAIWELEDMERTATDQYLDQDFQEFEITMEVARERFTTAEETAKEVKDAALLWVYAIEWLVTTSTLLLSSFALWALMIRKRLYKEVRTTRLD
jgi:hypothetical protein